MFPICAIRPYLPWPHDHKIQNIKALRNAASWGLKESKEAIEKLMSGVSVVCQLRQNEIDALRLQGFVVDEGNKQEISNTVDFALDDIDNFAKFIAAMFKSGIRFTVFQTASKRSVKLCQ